MRKARNEAQQQAANHQDDGIWRLQLLRQYAEDDNEQQQKQEDKLERMYVGRHGESLFQNTSGQRITDAETGVLSTA